MKIIDPHHHLWDLDKNFYPWLSGEPMEAVFGPYEAIRKNYLVSDLKNESKNHELLKSVHIQTEFDPENPVGETQWLQAVADEPSSGGLPNGIIGFCNFANKDAESILEHHTSFSNFRGIRHILNYHADPVLTFTDREYLKDQTWLNNYALLGRYDASFDLQVYWPQMRDAVRLANLYPSILIVLNHTGMPHDRSIEGIESWREGMRELASCDNIRCKISGLGMLDHNWNVQSIQPFVQDALDIFGIDKTMFASNFPVDKLFSNYDAIWDAFDEITKSLSEHEREKLFRTNAEKTYRI